MSKTQRKKPSSVRSGSGRTKRKLAGSTSKPLMNKADHVRRQSRVSHRVPAPDKVSATNNSPISDGPRAISGMLRTAANENRQPAGAEAWAFWSPMAVFLRQQTFFASMALNVIQSQRLWAQAFRRAS